MDGQRGRSIVFAGGGSGGHIAPALAIAERVAELDPTARCVFACSNRPVDAHMLTEAGQTHTALNAAPLSLRPTGILRFARGMIRATRQAKQLMRTLAAEQVVLLGGFVAAPAARAAAAMSIDTTLINLDVPPGKANRWIARRCTNIISAIPVPPADGAAPDGLDPPFDCRVVATPVRRRAIAAADAATCRQALGLDADRPMLLVTGASQGSTSINRFMAAVAAGHPGWLRGWQVLHLAGHDATDSIAGAYEAGSITAVVRPFLDDMGLAWGAAELAVTRAGANSVAEVAANAVPAIFLPYPWHEDQHQRRNAQPLADRGAAAIADDRIDADANLESIGPLLRDLIADDARRTAMRAVLRAHRPADGAAVIARELIVRDEA